MEEPTQVWRLKIFSRKQQQQPVEPEEPLPVEKTPSCKNCRFVKSKTCGSRKKHLRCRKPPVFDEPSLSSIKDSVSANCYSCCCNLKEFFKEVFKAIGGDPKNRVCDTLGEMTDLLLAIANDCVLFLRRVYICVFENFTEQD